ncbi:MAG TPA: hypothetical protein VJA94_03100 [Candidatus Angelobacter sp.]
MNESFPTESTIRQYLLGKLNEQQDLDGNLSEQICFNDELAEMVAAIEDEIIEDYLDSTLSAADRTAVEEYFLRPAERRERLNFARLLRDGIKKLQPVSTKGAVAASNDQPERVVKDSSGWIFHFRSHFRTYCECAALILVAVSLVYVLKIRQNLQSEIGAIHKDQSRLEQELAQEREHSANLMRELAQLEPPVASLPPFIGTFRGPETHQVEIKPFTRQIHVEIALPGASEDAYDVHVSKAGTPICTEAGLKPSSGALRFEIPVQGITTGDYTIVVIPQPAGREMSYKFHAEVAQ